MNITKRELATNENIKHIKKRVTNDIEFNYIILRYISQVYILETR